MPAAPEHVGPTNLNDYLSILNRRRVTGIFILVLVMVLGAGFTLTRPPTYRSSVSLAIRTPLDVSPLNDKSSSTPDRALRNEIEFISSDVVDKEVEKSLPKHAVVAVKASDVADVIQITATSSDRRLVAKTANAYADAYVRLRITEVVRANADASHEIERQLSDITTQVNDLNKAIAVLDSQIATTPLGPDLDSLQRQRSNLATSSQTRIESLLAQQQVYRTQLGNLGLRSESIRADGIRTLQRASVPSAPVGPSLVNNMIVATVVGAVLAAGIVFMAEYLDDSIKSKDALERILPPVLGVIPTVTGWRDHETELVVTLERPSSPEAEAYRSLRTSVKFLGIQQSLRVVQVTSPTAGEGKSATVVNLAVVLARAGESVLVVSGDLRRPRIERYINLDATVGLTSVLLGDVSAKEAIQPVSGVRGLFVLATGELPPNPSELLASERTQEFIEGLSTDYSMVLIDSPPVIPLTDALVTARFCDATIVVARAGRTSRRRLGRCLDLLQLVEANVIGSVLNDTQGRDDYLGDEYHYPYSRPRRSTSRLPKSAPTEVAHEASVGAPGDD